MKTTLPKTILLIVFLAITVYGQAQNPPAAPSDFSASPSATDYEILLAWTDNSDNETGFVIYRTQNDRDNPVEYHLSANTANFADTDVDPNIEYYYLLYAENEFGTSDAVETSTTLSRTPPPAPANVSAATGPMIFIQVTFTDNSDLETGYEIEHSDNPDAYGFYATKTVTGGTLGSVITTYLNEGPYGFTDPGSYYPPNTRVYLRIRAFILDHGHYTYGPFSPVVSAVTNDVPETPSDLTATTEGDHIRLHWTDNSSHEAAYFLVRYQGSFSPLEPVTALPANTTTYLDTTPEPNTAYKYRLFAADYFEYTRYPPQYWSDLLTKPERIVETTGMRIVLPPAPADVTAEGVSPEAIRVRFVDNSDVERWYEIEAATSPEGPFTAGFIEVGGTGVGTIVEVEMSPFEPGTTYYFRVRGAGEVNSQTEYGPFSPVVSATTFSNPEPEERINMMTKSIRKDGSDLYGVSLSDPAVGDFFHVFQTTGGDILSVHNTGGTLGYGAIGKITPSGFIKLYDVRHANQSSDLQQLSVEGNDGYIYSLRFSGGLKQIIRFKPDGTAYEEHNTGQRYLVKGSGLISASQGIFGVSRGVSENKGFIYKLKSDLSGVDIVYTFGADSLGTRPTGRLLAGRDGFLYGTARSGGVNRSGVIFKVSQQGDHYTVLHHFQWHTGAYPESGLVQGPDGFIYGAAQMGGKHTNGVIFKIREDGTDFQLVLDLYDINASAFYGANIMVSNDGYVYGSAGGAELFKIRTDGTGLEVVLDNDPKLPTPLQLLRQPFVPGVSVTAPEDQAADVPADLTIEYNTITGAAQYALELSTSPDFSGEITTLTSETTSVEVSGLEHNTTYYARVRSSLLPYYGAVTSFTTGSSSMAREASTQSSEASDVTAVYPNPSANMFTLKTGTTSVQAISLTDTNGTVLYQNNNPGTDSQLQFGGELKTGIYILKIRTSGGVKTMRLVKE